MYVHTIGNNIIEDDTWTIYRQTLMINDPYFHVEYATNVKFAEKLQDNKCPSLIDPALSSIFHFI